VVFVLLALFTAVSTFVFMLMSTGGPVFWWDLVPWVVRDVIRSIWSTFTGQPLTEDLFPF
jgi:hypothetical protein